MSKTANKTTQNSTSPAVFIASIEHRTRREDANTLLKWFEEVTDLQAVMWGSSIIGYGRYYYKYKSGREGRVHADRVLTAQECFITVYHARLS